MTSNIHLEGALAWWDAGMSVVPARDDGSKRPQFDTWKNFQATRARRDLMEKWYLNNPTWGVGLICGAVSGRLEMTEIESIKSDSDSLDRITEAAERHGILPLWEVLQDIGYCEVTPSGGFHFLYRIEDEVVPGNTKIAMDVTGKITYAETRGEGGFVVVAPSSGTVHPSGDSWSVIAGQPGVVPTVTWKERCALHAALKEALDERVLPEYTRPVSTGSYDRSQGERPGDAFNEDPSITIGDLLTRNGWKYLGTSRGQERYVHPASSDMSTHSACTGHNGSPNLYAWSGLPREDFYDKFSILTHLEFNGDFSAAGRYLRGQGYGTQTMSLDISDWDLDTPGTDVAQVVEKPLVQVGEDGLPRLSGQTFTSFNWREGSLPDLYASTYADHLKYVASSRMWRMWDGTRWAEDRLNVALNASIKLLKGVADYADAVKRTDPERGDILIKAAKGLSTMSKMKSLAGLAVSSPVFARSHDDFDQHENLVTVHNGVLDLDTQTLLPHDRDLMLTKRMNVVFDPNADRTVWGKLVSEWLPDPEVRAYVARLLAVTLTGKADERVIPMLYGGSGSGKTAFLEAIYHVFGDFGAIASEAALKPRADHDGPSEKLHQLKGSRMVKMSELSQGSVLNEALVKSITGSDTQSTRKLYGDIEEWKVQYVVWLATNHLPTISSNDEAIWNRVKPIHFPGRFIDDKGRVADPRNRDLGRKMAQNHASAILNWILAGLKDYQDNGLNEPDAIATWLGEYRDDVDSTRQFVNEAPDAGMIKLGDDQQIGARELYKVYVAWSTDNHARPLSIKSFGQRLEASGWKRVRRGQGMMWQGIGQVGFIADNQRPTWDWK